ncbi:MULTISPECIES: hypothetical protein [unclassified Microcoleus]|uniref:hypothetical protein n=1 Tax=unclassified Microcoleus TaxID=2642155 RepID=UPI002FD56180
MAFSIVLRRRKKEEGRRKKEEGRRKKEEGRRKKEEQKWKSEDGFSYRPDRNDKTYTASFLAINYFMFN